MSQGNTAVFARQGSLTSTQPAAGYNSPPGRTALLPPSQVGNTSVLRAGQPHYHQAERRGWGGSEADFLLCCPGELLYPPLDIVPRPRLGSFIFLDMQLFFCGTCKTSNLASHVSVTGRHQNCEWTLRSKLTN